jgi:hypothetical protein
MAGGRFRPAIMVGIVAAVTGIITPFAPASASTTVGAPFSWEGASWCPNYYGSNYGATCGSPTLSGTGSTAAFYPSQISYSGSTAPIYLDMNSRATESGAFNTQTQQTWSAPATLSEQINLPCNRAGQVENWPAFWLVTTGAWPAGGEIDVMEGLNGTVQWHYHYLSALGVDSSVGGGLAGFSGCGTNTYEVNWTTSAITIYYNNQEAGTVTPAEIGVPLASGPMFVVNDYAASPVYGGPTVGNTKMEVFNFSANTIAGPNEQSPDQQGPNQQSPDQQSPDQQDPNQQGFNGMWMTGVR